MIYGNSILGINKVLDLNSAFQWNHLNHITSFKFWIEMNEYYEKIGLIEVTFQLQYMDDYMVKILFTDVANLNVKAMGKCNQLLGFEIVDKSQDGWELQYYINDYENSLMRFYCNGIEVLDVSKIE